MVDDSSARRAFWASLPYGVVLPDGRAVDVHVGAHAPDVDAALPGCAAWAYLTACNPGGRRVDEDVNVAAQTALRAAIAARGLRTLPGTGGRGDDPGWPPEDSVVVGGLDLVDAHALARDFGQAAFLYARRGAPVALVDVTTAAFAARRALHTVAFVHVDGAGRCLMARPRGRALFFMPGGKKEPGEDDAQALVRELREELGVALDPTTVFARFVVEERAFGASEPTVVRMACYAGRVMGTPAASREIEALRWLTLDDVALVPPAGQEVLRRLGSPPAGR